MKALLLLLLAAPLRAAGLPANVRLVDATGALTAEWLLPAGSARDCRLVADPKGRPWLGCKNRWLLAPFYASAYASEKSFRSLAWLREGSLLAVSGETVGVFALSPASKKPAGKVTFKPLVVFQDKRVALHQGFGDAAYITARGDGGTEVYLIALEGDKWAHRLLFTTAKRVSAVGGDGKTTFVALERKVLGLAPGQVQELFEHPDAEITSLEYSPKLGLFYGTDRGAGYLGSRWRDEFLSAAGAQIRLAGEELLVLPPGGGVLKLSGLREFSELDARLAAADELEQAEKKP